jgi:hypothetical protein
MGCRLECTITIFCAETNAGMISMVSETAVNRYRREAEECRRNAKNAITCIDREAWLRLAGRWEKLAEDAELNPLLEKRSR